MPDLTTSCPTRSGIWEIAGQAGYDNEVGLEMMEVNCNNDGVE